MKAFLARLLGCLGAFALCGLLFPGSCTAGGIVWGGGISAVLYLLVRPLLQTVLLPFNLLLFGIFTPLTDALLVLWACAWTPGADMGYWQAVCAALFISLFWLPYGAAGRKAAKGLS